MTLNALITTVRQDDHRQKDRQHQQTRLAQRKIMNTSRCLIGCVNNACDDVYKDLRLVGVLFFYPNTTLSVLLLDG